VVAISNDLLSSPVAIKTRGGTLTIAWSGGDNAVTMKGPAATVFEGTVEL
jgi:diaminopimelate epimerase